MNTVSILKLEYSINFNDADDGACYAGDGSRILSVHRLKKDADSIAKEFNDVVDLAEKEDVVFPIQKFNNILKDKFGITLHDISDGYDFRLAVETHGVID